jgi:3-deoxy-D-manno-octulosonate 8-phosphate phosphatase (KDO 8-P phosphatase)
MEKARKIKCFISDVDGVLTDGLITLDNTGNETKSFNVQDGMGLKLLMSAGIHVAVITTARNQVVGHRMQQLGIEHFFIGQVCKRDAYDTLKNRLQLPDEAFAYIGDDLPDLDIIRQVGMAVAVANALPQVKEFAAWQTQAHGGRGGVREVCDLILTAQNKSEEALARYLAS